MTYVREPATEPGPARGGISSPMRTLVVLGTAIVAGYLAASAGYVLTLRPSGVVFLWPPSGVVLAALILMPRREWVALAGGALLGNALADLQHGAHVWLAFSGSAANTAEQVLAASVFTGLAGARPRFRKLRDVGVLVLATAIASNAVTAFVGGAVLRAFVTAGYWRAWFNWWTGDGMGMLLLAPVVLLWADAIRRRKRPSIGAAGETIALVAGIAVISTLLLTRSSLAGHAYLIFPLLIWAGIRLGPLGAATATLAVTVVMAVLAVRDALPVGVSRGQFNQVLEVYTFLAVACLSSLVPSALLAERADAARDLRESEGRFREIADLINEAFFVIDLASRRTLYVNPGWAEIWGRPIEDGYDPQVWFNAIHLDDRAAMVEAMQQNASGSATVNVFRIVRPTGEVRWLRGRAFPVRDAAGVVRRVAGVTADITDLRETEQRFVQAQKLEAVGRLASGVAHDFNNLLTVMFGEADELITRLKRHEDLESVAGIRRAAESAATLTRQLLAFSRRQIVEPVVFDLNAAVADASRMLRRLIGEDIRVDVRLAPESLGVRADRGQIEQLITNLAVNARDAMPNGGTLTIETMGVTIDPSKPAPSVPRPDGLAGSVALVFSDTGTGMSEETLSHAFDPFFTTKEMGRGTGLGLSTCHGIVTGAGGQITIRSRIGEGTTVRVELPRVPVEAAATAPMTPSTSARGHERILIVEDEPAVRNITGRMLRAQGYQVLEASDAADAMHQLQMSSPPVHLLVTDVVLPGVGGRELADLITAAQPGIKTLFVTGYMDDVILKDRMLAGDRTILPKPFTAEALAQRVRDVLDGGV